jgi:hypothetical protein
MVVEGCNVEFPGKPLYDSNTGGYTGVSFPGTGPDNITSGTFTVTAGARWNFCPNCGRKVEHVWNFCTDCGHRLHNDINWFPNGLFPTSR